MMGFLLYFIKPILVLFKFFAPLFIVLLFFSGKCYRSDTGGWVDVKIVYCSDKSGITTDLSSCWSYREEHIGSRVTIRNQFGLRFV